MSERKVKSSGQRRHGKSEINLALFLFQASFQGNHQDLKDVIFSDKIKKEKRHVALNARDAEGKPILINCLKGSAEKETETNHLECIKLLLSTGVSIDSKDVHGRSCVFWAIMLDRYEICSYLLQQGASANTVDNGNVSPIHLAISKRSQKFLELLCSFGPPEILQAADGTNRTPLCHALFINASNLFYALLEGGADPDGVTNNGRALISFTIEQNKHVYTEMLLKHNANLYPNGSNQVNMIHLAAMQKDPVSLELLTQYCNVTDLQSRDNQGKTPLMCAVQYGSEKNASILLEAKVNSNCADNDGRTALHYTSTNVNSSCVDLLLSHNPSLLNKVNSQNRCPIHFAIINNNQVVVRALLDHRADYNVLDNEGHTLIHYASEYSATACLAELVSIGLSVNVPDTHQVYPIHYAVRLEEGEQPDIKIVYLKALVETGVQLDVVDAQGLQPLHWAVCMGFTEALRILLIEDVDANATTTSHEKLSPLHLACNSGKLECLELLLQQPELKVDPVNSKGYTPLMLACSMKNQKFTELLLEKGANPDHQASSDGKIPAHIAAANATVDCLWLLSLKRANFDAKNNIGETPIHVACMNVDDACVRFLLARKCDVNAQQNNGLTALHITVNSKNYNRTNLLLQNNANCNVILYTQNKDTPLDFALENSDYKCIKLLRSYGARTAHSIMSHAAITIQHAWKQYRKKKGVSRDGVPFTNTESICTSSNASESVSVMEYKNDLRYRQEIEHVHETSMRRSNVSDDDRHKEISPTVPCRKCGKANTNWGEWLKEENMKAFQDKLASGDREIQLMRQLMKETENMLVRAKNVTDEADNIINGRAFQRMKFANKAYLEEKRRRKKEIQQRKENGERMRLFESHPT